MKKILTTILVVALAGGAWGDNVAKIGDTEYETLDGAIEAVSASGTITLLKNAELAFSPITKSFKIESAGAKIVLKDDITLNTSKTITTFTDLTIDLAGHTITNVGSGKIQCGEYYHKESTLTIMDSSTGGKITGGNYSSAPLTQYGNGSTIVLKDDVAISGTYLGITSGGGQVIVEDSATVYGGTYGVKNTATSDGVTDLNYSGNAISGGTSAAWGPAELTVAGKTFYAKTVSGLVPKVPADGTEYTITANNNDAGLSGAVIQGGQKVVVDLNGKTVSLRDELKIYEGHLTIKNGTVSNSGTRLICVYASDDATKVAGDYNSLTIEEDATLTTTVVVYPAGYGTQNASNKAYGTKVTIDGTIVGTSSGTVSINGVAHEGNSVIEVNGTITNASTGAIYLAGYGITYVKSGATVTGTTGIEVRAGELNVTGGTISGTAATATNTSNDSGNTTSGAGIAVAQHVTQLPIAINVTGGGISGAAALYVVNPQNNVSDDDISINISCPPPSVPVFTGDLVVADTRADVKISSGSFTVNPSVYIVPGYTAIDNQDGTWTVGRVVIETGDLQPSEPVADDATEATYTVNTTVKMGDTVISSTASQTVNVSVPSSDIGGTTLSSVKLDSVITAAIEAQGTDASAVTDIEILVNAVDTNTVNEAIVYEVKPEAIVTVTQGGVSTQSEPIELSNDDLAAGASFTILLDVTPLGAVAGDSVKVAHESDDPAYAKETYFVQAFAGDDGKVYVRVTVSHFSTFTLSLLSTQPVTTSVQSVNLFGAVKVEGVASNMFVAVPFDGFDGGARQAKDVVHPAGLANDTKMYVYDPSQDKYDVFKTSAGAWTQASKVTIGASDTVSVDNPSLEREVKSGSGVIVERTDKTQALYLYGQIPTNTSVTITTESALVSVPSTNALEAVDLNALDWTGVTSSTCNTAGTRLSSNGGKDMIKFRSPDGKTVSYYYFGGKWGPNYRPSSWDGKATVPAGTAFWYTQKSDSVTTVTVKW